MKTYLIDNERSSHVKSGPGLVQLLDGLLRAIRRSFVISTLIKHSASKFIGMCVKSCTVYHFPSYIEIAESCLWPTIKIVHFCQSFLNERSLKNLLMISAWFNNIFLLPIRIRLFCKIKKCQWGLLSHGKSWKKFELDPLLSNWIWSPRVLLGTRFF